jgi:hypothetical protein
VAIYRSNNYTAVYFPAHNYIYVHLCSEAKSEITVEYVCGVGVYPCLRCGVNDSAFVPVYGI